MRKVLLVLALIGASFAGGAVVNGPGLAWARKMVLGQANEGYAALRGDDLVKSDTGSAKPESEPPRDVPAAPLPPLDQIPTPKPSVDVPEKPETPDPTTAKSNPSEPTESDPARIPDPPKDASPAPALLPPQNDPAVNNASLAREVGAAAADPASTPATWADLRRRMKELGISRYWIEAEPGGPARFRCVIPVAGARAVAQHFEAEGDDDFQAADAALRRVALWKATEP